MDMKIPAILATVSARSLAGGGSQVTATAEGVLKESWDNSYSFRWESRMSGEGLSWLPPAESLAKYTIQLPGKISSSRLGDPISNIRQQIRGGKLTDQPVWHPMIRSDYRGDAWYQTTVDIPQTWLGQIRGLLLERVCWVS